MSSSLAPPPRDGRDPARSAAAALTGLRGIDQLAVFEAVFGQSPIGACIFDAQCRYVTANSALLDLIGLPLAQLVGRPVEDVLGPLGARIAGNLRRAMSEGPVVNLEFQGSTYAQEGRPRTFLASYFRLEDAGGGLLGVASLVNDVTEDRQVRDELAAANRRLALLSGVSEVLASSLDVQATLTAFADLVVPAFADHCVIDLVDDEPGVVRRVALVHAEGLAPAREAWVPPGDVVAYPADHPAAEAMRSGRAVLEHAPDDPAYEPPAPTRESAEYGREVGVRSAMTVPLVARGAVLGAVSFVTSASGRVLTDADVEMATALASRAALALDNARMFGREQRIALTLQRSLLPEQLPETPTLEAAAVYHPAAQDGSVGGDWYDVIPLPCGRVGLVMGDVMGRGVQAAALMGQVRAAVRAYAAQDLRPGLVLGYLDELVRGLGDDTIVTCVYAVYDPVEEALCVANAGHPPPLLVGPAGVVRLDVHGPVLGAGIPAYEQDEVAFVDGTVLALYTDGLVERRSEDVDARTDLLGAELAGVASLPDAVRSVVERLGSDAADPDDVAVMLVRPRPGARPQVARLDVVPHAARVREIRHFAADAMTGWQAPAEVADQVQLVVTELVTNVIQHASGHEATVRIERHADRYVVAVVDPDSAPPLPGRAEPDDEGGRGLHLVEALAHRWGSRQLPMGGKVVWVELMPSR